MAELIFRREERGRRIFAGNVGGVRVLHGKSTNHRMRPRPFVAKSPASGGRDIISSAHRGFTHILARSALILCLRSRAGRTPRTVAFTSLSSAGRRLSCHYCRSNPPRSSVSLPIWMGPPSASVSRMIITASMAAAVSLAACTSPDLKSSQGISSEATCS